MNNLSIKNAFVWVAVFAGVALLFGCGGGGSSTGGTTTTGTNTNGGGTNGTVKPGITQISIEFPDEINDAGAVAGNFGGMQYFGGSGQYRSGAGTITSLKALDGTTNNAHVQAANDSGVIVGNCAGTATYWMSGAVAKLNVPSGSTNSVAASINDSGQVVGWETVSNPGTKEVQAVSESGVPTGGTFTLTLSVGGTSEKTADIPYNATAAQVAGAMNVLPGVGNNGGVNGTGGPLPAAAVAITWAVPGPQATMVPGANLTGRSNPTVHVLQTTLGVTSSIQTNGLFWSSISASPTVLSVPGLFATQIDKNGDVVGYVQTQSPYTNTYYRFGAGGGAPVKVGSTSFNPYVSINASGTMVISEGSNSQATLIPLSGAPTDIVTGASNLHIDNQDDVVGTYENSSGLLQPFIWNKAKGLVNLATYLPKNSGWTNITPIWINDHGQVVGVGYLNQSLQSFILQLPNGAY